METLLRYESMVKRDLYRAIHQLDRLQHKRLNGKGLAKGKL